ncbi:MAG: divergent polysaccharide deacetylase family protein [Parvularculaceae bacterium]|nr:divergent polysaccharide deacetylase family protein [Parvularculaceae bacterium]
MKTKSARRARKAGKRSIELLPPGGLGLKVVFTPPWDKSAFALAALVGAALGVAGAIAAGGAQTAQAGYAAVHDLRDAPLAGAHGARSELIARIAALGSSERLQPPAPKDAAAGRPKLIIIFDDMGPNREAFRTVMNMPGPVTLSFLPYADGLQPLVDEAKRRGDEVLLHLPMEPRGTADPGPHSLRSDMRPEALFETLMWNLDRFEGYAGVNNHMGSRFTRDGQAMKRVLAALDQRGLFFVDSLTTGGSTGSSAGAAVGAEVFVRDVFLDAEPGRDAIQRQFALAEAIAVKTGYAIVICHPHAETLDMIGPWLTTAPARGFELATVASLRAGRSRTLAAKN